MKHSARQTESRSLAHSLGGMSLAFVLLAGLGLMVAVAVASLPLKAAEVPSGKLTLGQWLDRIQFQGAVLPADDVKYTGRAVVSVYGLMRNHANEIVILYGYSSLNGGSVYRAYGLGGEKVLAEFSYPDSGSASDLPPPFTQIRDYITRESVETWAVKSLLSPFAVSANLRVVAHNQGQCAGPFAYWLEWQRQSPGPSQFSEPQISSVGRMIVRLDTQPRPFVIQPACPLAANSDATMVTANSTVASMYFGQGAATGNGGLLAFASTEPLVMRFDSAQNARIVDAQFNGKKHRIALRSFNPDVYDQVVIQTLGQIPQGSVPNGAGSSSFNQQPDLSHTRLVSLPTAPAAAIDGTSLAMRWYQAMLRRLGLR
ncbi:MAG: hypothetical protein QM523_04420 [Candidatus Pacebacteria bacterium]|nr:hypothetical protein [Candidatus Paceibacterota bacterium]